MKHIAIIPARGGSKRIPQKNIYPFQGKPMLAWTIEAALAADLFDRVLVSTDSPEIAEVAEKFGVEVPFYRADYTDDHAPVSQATRSAVENAMDFYDEEYETVTQLMVNTPLRTTEDIQSAFHHFQQNEAPSQISCFAFGWMNPWWACTLDKQARPAFVFHDKIGDRSQDLPQLYCPTGAIWIAAVSQLIAHDTFYCPGHIFFPIPWQSAVDIDEHADLEMAAAVYIWREQHS
jgi:CMP-N-acetylneuraminic acid synthetase